MNICVSSTNASLNPLIHLLSFTCPRMTNSFWNSIWAGGGVGGKRMINSPHE